MKKEIRKRKKLYYRRLALLSREVKRKEAIIRYTYLKKALLFEDLTDINIILDSIKNIKEYILCYLENLNYIDLCLDRGYETNEKIGELLQEISDMILLIENYYKVNLERIEGENTNLKAHYFKIDLKEKDKKINFKIKKLNIGKIPRLEAKRI